jgi:hypothetical protein
MKRTRLVPLVVAAVVALAATACSDGLRDATRTDGVSERSAASGDDTRGFANPQGDPAEPVNVGDWCLRAQSNSGTQGFETSRNITACIVMSNEMRRFAAPGVLGKVNFPLGVTKAKCGEKVSLENSTDSTCEKTKGFWGEVRTEGVMASNVRQKGARFTFPNPFLVSAAIQYQPETIWSGVETTTFVGSNVAPFSLSQSQVELKVNIPTTGTNTASCTSAKFIVCASQHDTTREFSERTYFWVLRSLPMSIGIKNSTPYPMVASGAPTVGSGFLIDPVGTTADLSTLPAGTQAYVGGYRTTNASDSQTWTGTFTVKTPRGDATVTISIKLSVGKDGVTLENESLCTVQSLNAIQIKCDKPVPTNDDYFRQFDVQIKDF